MSDEKKDAQEDLAGVATGALEPAAMHEPKDAVGGEPLPHETYGETAGKPLDEPIVPAEAEAPAAEVVSDEAIKSDGDGAGEGASGEAGPADADLDGGTEGDVGSTEDKDGVAEAPTEAPPAELAEGEVDGGSSDGDDGLSDAGAADSGPAGDGAVAGDAAEPNSSGPAADSPDDAVGPGDSEPAADPEPAPTPVDKEPAAEPAASSEKPAEPAAPSAPASPTLGSVRGEVDQISELPDDALAALRDGGIALFIFLARLERADDKLEGEAKARVSAVKNATVQLLAAVERVFVRQG